MADSQVAISVPQDIIKAHVQAAVHQVLSRDPEGLVRAVVDAAMKQRRNSYDRETIWEEKLNEAIRAVAEEAFREWLEEQKPLIKRLVRERFGGPKGKATVNDMVDRLTAALSTVNLRVSIGNMG